jgi:hypothetical protein
VTNRKSELQRVIINHHVWRRWGSRPRVTIQDNGWQRDYVLQCFLTGNKACQYVTTLGEKQHIPWNWTSLSRMRNICQAWPIVIKREKVRESVLKHQKDWHRRQTGQNGEFRIMRGNAWRGVTMRDKTWSGVKIESVYEQHWRIIITVTEKSEVTRPNHPWPSSAT